MEILTVKLRKSHKIYNIHNNNIFIKVNSMAILKTEHGLDIGKIIKKNANIKNSKIDVKGKLIRKATREDFDRLPGIKTIEQDAFNSCQEKAKLKSLDLKLISVKSIFDKTKIIFFFVAENRIDFRELVRELASIFRTRIEMRQIGVRDEARLVGGFGPCGREHCCSHQGEEFEPVSIKMAKEQNLNLNSQKISGMCGRLLCCLSYEYSTYKEINISLPRYGNDIYVKDKKYPVISVNTLDESISITDNERIIRIPKDYLNYHEGNHHIKKKYADKVFNIEDEFGN